MITVICEICGHKLGKADPAELSDPMRGDMFKSVNPERGYPPPFHPSADWMWMRCPMCRKRPFIFKDRVKIDCGWYYFGGEVPRGKSAADLRQDRIEKEWADLEKAEQQKDGLFTCPVCARVFTSQQGLASHSKVHKRK